MADGAVPARQMQLGVVASLNWEAGFGYVRDQTGTHQYIFIVGKAIKHSQARLLAVGMAVHFRVSGLGRVDELVIV